MCFFTFELGVYKKTVWKRNLMFHSWLRPRAISVITERRRWALGSEMLRYRFLRSERVFDSVQQLSVSTQAQQLRQFAQSVAPNRGGGFKPATMNTGGEFRPQTTARADSPHALLMLISEGVAGFMTDVNPPTRLADFTEPFFSLWTHSCKKKKKKKRKVVSQWVHTEAVQEISTAAEWTLRWDCFCCSPE